MDDIKDYTNYLTTLTRTVKTNRDSFNEDDPKIIFFFSLMRMAKLDVSLRLIVMSREPADLVGFVPFHHHTHMPSSTLRLACTLDVLILSNLHRNSLYAPQEFKINFFDGWN